MRKHARGRATQGEARSEDARGGATGRKGRERKLDRFVTVA